MVENPGKAYTALKRMGAQPGDCLDDGSFSLKEHSDANLSLAESAERISEHFAAISQLYQPLDITRLPTYVREIMENEPLNTEEPILSEMEVFKKIEKAKKPKGVVPGDLPKKLLKEFAMELATPATKIFQNSINKKEWPRQWKSEHEGPSE